MQGAGFEHLLPRSGGEARPGSCSRLPGAGSRGTLWQVTFPRASASSPGIEGENRIHPVQWVVVCTEGNGPGATVVSE